VIEGLSERDSNAWRNIRILGTGQQTMFFVSPGNSPKSVACDVCKGKISLLCQASLAHCLLDQSEKY
jgi:hypothetical protein